MAKDFHASMTERSIGRNLRIWRDARGMSLSEAAKLVRFSSAKLSTMENAVQPLDPLDIMCVGHAYERSILEWKEQARRAEAEATRRSTAEAICGLIHQSFQALRQSALSPAASVELIAEIADEMATGSDRSAPGRRSVNG